MTANPWVSSVFRTELAAPAAPADDPHGLTEMERAFVVAFFGAANRTGTVACRLAGYAGDNATLAVQAVRLKARPRVAAAMEAERARLDAQPEPQATEVPPAPTSAPESQPSPPAGIVAPPVNATLMSSVKEPVESPDVQALRDVQARTEPANRLAGILARL